MKVVELQTVTKLDIPTERICRKAADAELAQAVVIGYEKDGSFYFASSLASGPEVLWMLEQAKQKLLAIST